MEMTVEQKFAKAMLNLRELRPFYSAVYEVIEKRESTQIETIGVGTNDMAYNHDFIDKTEFNEFIFIILHEIAHIALMHVSRREHRDAKLWNVACDIYVNKVLSNEFRIHPGERRSVNGIDIKMPTNCLFCDTIDTEKDFVEDMYESLEEQANKNGYNQGSNGEKYVFRVGNNSNNRGKLVEISKDSETDLIDNGDDSNVKQQKSEKVVADAIVRIDMSSSNQGNQEGGLIVLARKRLESHLDWKKLLRRYLISACRSDSSFSRPDKRMFYQKAIYPGQIQDEINSIKGIKICIDTSGSISDEDIEHFCGQVYSLTKQFNIDAELIYWDSDIQSTGEFKDYREFERVDIYGRGGTDPSVIFNYFDSKKCKVKPVVTLIFTDGFFSVSNISALQRKKYKDTIWIMTKNSNKSFDVPFGKKAEVKFN